MASLVEEAHAMPAGAIRFARDVGWVKPPGHLAALQTSVRTEHGGELAAVHEALDERFNHASDDYMNVFRAAAEMAVMERVGREGLQVDDRRQLRDLWQALLSAPN